MYVYVFVAIVIDTHSKNSSRAYNIQCKSLQTRTTVQEESDSEEFIWMHGSLHYQMSYVHVKVHTQWFFSKGNKLKIVNTLK
jgi:hypothetical protein